MYPNAVLTMYYVCRYPQAVLSMYYNNVPTMYFVCRYPQAVPSMYPNIVPTMYYVVGILKLYFPVLGRVGNQRSARSSSTGIKYV